MKFTDAGVIESVVWSMRLSDHPRAENRARIDSLFNGFPPYSDNEVRDNNIETNVNFLESVQLAHDARRQYYNAFLKPGDFFKVTLDSGPAHRRGEWSTTITNELNRILKRSRPYMEVLRSTFASTVLHGIGPVSWRDRERWCPDALGIQDVMVPSQTRVSLENLTFFAVFRPYTVEQLYLMTHGPKVDPAWNMDVVNKAIKWADKQGLESLPFHDIYSPESLQERMKSDLGFYSADAVPTVDCWDFYFYNHDGDECGWNRRVILDANWGIGTGGSIPTESKIGTRGEFLYDPGKRKYADDLSEIIHFQFGDLSAVAPFKYHSVRSLGFMLFAICHLQNRIRCKFSDAVFENLLQYFRVNNMDDAERSIKINLIDKGYIDQGVEFIKQSDRWQVNERLVQGALAHNREIMGANTSSFTQDYDFGKEQTEKTATQVNAEVATTSALVGSMLMQAYNYAEFQYHEIARRFCMPNSRDSDVRRFRLDCLKSGVPEEMLDSNRWKIDAERVLGSGNKILEMTIAERLMAYRNLYDPESQRDILRDYTLAVTDDAGRTERLVPVQPEKVTDAVHDAQLASAALMMGLPVFPKKGLNHIEYVDTLLGNMELVISRIEQRGGMEQGTGGGMATEEEVVGLQNLAQHIAEHIQIVAQDPNEKERVKQWGDALSKMMNLVRAYVQRIAEEQQAGNGVPAGPDPETLAKLEGQQMMNQAKTQNTRESHAARTAQRQVQWEAEERRKQDQHALDMQMQEEELAMTLANKQVNNRKNDIPKG